MVDVELLRLLNCLITDWCTQRGYECDTRANRIIIYNNDKKIQYKIRKDMFINADHVIQTFIKIREELESRFRENESD